MPRPPRLVVPGQPLHLIQRGNNRTASFIDRADFLCYKRVLHEASGHARCLIHAYVLMTNHVHLLVTPESKTGPARLMQAVGRQYVRYFNDRHARTGTLWEGRYRSALIDSEHYFLACSRYIELNPVRAGMVARPGMYRWSSFRSNANDGADVLLTPHAVYLALGDEPGPRHRAYRALFQGTHEPETVHDIRNATAAGTAVSAARHRAVLEAARRAAIRPAHGGDRRSASFRRTPAPGSTTPTP